MLASIAAIFTGIKSTLTLVNEIVSGAKALAAFIQANKDEAWFQASAQTFKELRDAKTDDERKAAGRKLRDNWRSL